MKREMGSTSGRRVAPGCRFLRWQRFAWTGGLPMGAFLVFAATCASAAVRYVNVNGANPTPPHTSWATAATTIQQAVDVAVAGDEILVANGVYQTGGRVVYGTLSNRVAVTKPVKVRSVNGPAVTVIRGNTPQTAEDGPVRCVYLTNGAALIGFTLTNGATLSFGDEVREHRGGGVWCESTNAVLSNCVLIGNSASFAGGGAFNATLNNCNLSNNGSIEFGGGAFNCVLNHCSLNENQSGEGGAAANSILNSCIVSTNSAYDGGGVSGGTLNNCVLTANGAAPFVWGSGSGGAAAFATLNNCTLINNYAEGRGGGAFICQVTNCIVYDNEGAFGSNYFDSTLAYTCTKPLPASGAGNITNAPLFVNQVTGNLRLQSNSPCINAGNNAYVIGSADLDGRPRIVGAAVDMGAYEYQADFIAWLQQHGLPADGSADYADADGDRANNWQEWHAGTNPTNAASVLRLLAPAPGMPGVIVRWQSVVNRTYFLERSSNLGTDPPFQVLRSNITGQAGSTAYNDTAAVNASLFFYRVGVHQ